MVKITEELVRKRSEHNELLINTLEEIALHQEDIERIEHLQNWCRDLKILLLQNNLIPKIENLFKLKKLEYLNLAINNIEHIENLEKLESLNKLDLTLNFIGELTSIENLRENYNLRDLILTGNPCCDYKHYREYVIATLPQLSNLDCEEIQLTQRLQAQKRLKEYRASIVQSQAKYAMERDEQKIRIAEQKEELQAKMDSFENEDEKSKTFWEAKSEHCPETRIEIAKYHKKCREPKDVGKAENLNCKRDPLKLFAPCGRPYNVNQAKLGFNFQDEDDMYILELEVYKHLDTSYIQADVETNYIRVTVKKKIFQISLAEEVNLAEASVVRSQITGQLVVKVPKLRKNELQTIKAKKPTSDANRFKKNGRAELKGTVDIKSVCKKDKTDIDDDIPDLV